MELSNNSIMLHAITVGSILIFKLVVLLIGYLIAKLGYELLVKGITGGFKFHAELKGTKADLISASPGIFFIFLATVLITIAVIKDKPFRTNVQGVIDTQAETTGHKNQLPENIPDNLE